MSQTPVNVGDPPRRSPVAIITPIAVAALTLAMIAWTAWPTLTPLPQVTVAQAVFDRSSEPEPAQQGEAEPRRSGVTVQAPGWLEAEPFFVAAAALADGIVESVEVLEGDRVEKGQVVAQLVAEDSELRVSSARAAVARAEADLRLAEAERRAAQTDWDEPVERERAVASGRASVAEIRGELEQLPSLIDAARAHLRTLEEELKRAQQSRERGAATELEVITAEQGLLAQAATVRSLEARGPILRARLDRFEADLRAAERNLDLRIAERRRLDTAAAAVAEAAAALESARVELAEAELELDRMVIRAPISGFVQRRLKLPGDKAITMMDSPHSAHIVHLYDPERLQVRVDVPLADAQHVFVGQRCEVVVDVLPDATFEGVVLRTTHEADLQKNTLQVKVKVIDPSPLLRPEMLTRVRFLPVGGADAGGSSGAESAAAVLVPSAALLGEGPDRRLITIRDRREGRGTTRVVPVTVGGREAGAVRVTGGLRAGDLVVVDPDPALGAGKRVRFKSSSGEARS